MALAESCIQVGFTAFEQINRCFKLGRFGHAGAQYMRRCGSVFGWLRHVLGLVVDLHGHAGQAGVMRPKLAQHQLLQVPDIVVVVDDGIGVKVVA